MGAARFLGQVLHPPETANRSLRDDRLHFCTIRIVAYAVSKSTNTLLTAVSTRPHVETAVFVEMTFRKHKTRASSPGGAKSG